ncbi:MAG: serine/threonine-protein kinase [Actinomycetes bacterium]
MAEPGALIAGRYRLVRELGRGGMGVVWEAHDERLERPVAIKQLHTQAGLDLADAELAKQRAMREARITARLHHPNAITVFDAVEHEGQPCLVMQLVPSVPLTQVLRELKVLEAPETARLGAQVAAALAEAHRVGVVHRDVKPGNILIGDDGVARISDFGISRALGDTTLTTTGMMSGTPAYLAPEVARGSESTAASDVFSLGATLYTAVEGTPPFGTDPNVMALLHRVAVGDFDPPRRAGPLAPLLQRMLAREPQDRPAMGEVASSLNALVNGGSSTSDAATLIAPIVAPSAGSAEGGDPTRSFAAGAAPIPAPPTPAPSTTALPTTTPRPQPRRPPRRRRRPR